MKKLLSFTLAITFIFTTMFCVPSSANAQTKAPATSITSLSARTKGFKVKWKKKSVKGYQIQYSTNSNFKNAKKITVKNGNATTKTVKGLKAKKKYYVRVRTYKLKNSERVYSAWSKKRYVTTKASSGKKRGTTVYITPTGERYHYSKSCAGKNAIPTTLSKAKQQSYTPCKKCAM
ncbi:MAG: fibronectin type III domain-containing protein [Eubacterium sp.]|nr:fibronectin type III domain-containing protein [Eubacterium sp.]